MDVHPGKRTGLSSRNPGEKIYIYISTVIVRRQFKMQLKMKNYIKIDMFSICNIDAMLNELILMTTLILLLYDGKKLIK